MFNPAHLVESVLGILQVTGFIAQKKSRQEFPPLLGPAIEKIKVEPLHLKNNAWQQWHALVLNMY